MKLLIMHTVDKPSLNKPTNNNKECFFMKTKYPIVQST